VGIKATVKRLSQKNRTTMEIYRKAADTYKYLRTLKYRVKPLNKKLVCFESYKGKNISCSPKSIYLEMLNDPRFEDYRFVWAVNDKKKYKEFLKEYENEDHGRTKIVTRNSDRHYESVCTAGYRITNSTGDRFLLKRKGQVYVQAWHGTPLKRLGCDIVRDGNASMKIKQIHKQYIREGRQADFFLSPSEYATKCFKSAFCLRDDQILEAGYPRNDLLLSADAQSVREDIKKRLGIAAEDERIIILYAPTYRDVGYKLGEGFHNELTVDLVRLKELFGDRALVIFRKHYFSKVTYDREALRGFVYDASLFPDINELYLTADVLLTDYSSVMFDYALLKRPIVFFMKDIDIYRGELRDFYTEPEGLPGPVCKDDEGLYEALDDTLLKVSNGSFVPDETYKAFLSKFSPYEDGKRAKAVIDGIFGK